MAGALRKTMLYLGLAEGENPEGQMDYVDEIVEQPEYEEVAPVAVPERNAQVTPISRGVAGDLRRITTVHPRSYNDAKVIGEAFRSGTPVIMNLSEMNDADAKRLVDFSAGIVFGLRGAIERVTSKVFLLSPATVEIATPERAVPPASSAFYNQS